MYVITGATGNTGKIIANTLLDAGKKVRLISRDAEHVKELTDKGAEAAIGSLEDIEFMQTTNAGHLFEDAKRTEQTTTPTSVEDFAQVFANVYNS